MAKSWISIEVVLVEGRGIDFWPRPGRVFAASRSHTFAQLSNAIDVAFARWDFSHLHQFILEDGTNLTTIFKELLFEDEMSAIDDRSTKLAILKPGERFIYEFDFGDGWTHLCTVGEKRIDPLETLGIIPSEPLPYWGWGTMPDQYGRNWDGDDGESPPPENPEKRDLPKLYPGWGSRS